MLSLLQRLLLGSLLLLALVTGLSFLVRGSFMAISGLDGEQKVMDRAVGSMAAAQAAVAREQILVERSLLHLATDDGTDVRVVGAVPLGARMPVAPHASVAANGASETRLDAGEIAQIAPGPVPREVDIHEQSERAQDRLVVARDALRNLLQAPDVATAPELTSEMAAHTRIYKRLHHVPPDMAARRISAEELEPIDRSLSNKLEQLREQRARLDDTLELERESLSARLIGACGAAIVSAIAVIVAMLFFVLRPLRLAAKAARRMGQGDLQQRIDWPRRDELGTLATEFNRMAIKLRDLRDTESGRRAMEQQLSDAVVQSIFEPVIVTDGRGQLLKLNGAARELLGDRAGDRMALNQTPGGTQILSAIETAITMQRGVASEDGRDGGSGSGLEGEAAMAPIRFGQQGRNFRLRTTPMRDAEGQVLGAVTVLEDVTELQALDVFKTRFLAVASQKLRDPLEKLRVAIHALARGYAGELKPLQADVVEGAQGEAEALDDLMADLFAVAELDSGRRTLKLERLRPIDLLREAQAHVRAATLEQGLTVEVEAYADLQRVEGDRRALRSIFENLLSNAIRNTGSGGYVRLTATESKNVVHFCVADTGRGIEPERLSMIFGRFSSGSDEGRGLGLALVRRLVESQGGQISVESRVGQGTTFTFTLPVARPMETRHSVEVG
jgi:NtrC-family two-component system sensor histidine kinase KinB